MASASTGARWPGGREGQARAARPAPYQVPSPLRPWWLLCWTAETQAVSQQQWHLDRPPASLARLQDLGVAASGCARHLCQPGMSVLLPEFNQQGQ
jgi:hypothetical protein